MPISLLTEITCTLVWHEANLFQHPLHQNIISHGMKQSMWIMGSIQTTLKETFISSFAEDNTEKLFEKHVLTCLRKTWLNLHELLRCISNILSYGFPLQIKGETWGQFINLLRTWQIELQTVFFFMFKFSFGDHERLQKH